MNLPNKITIFRILMVPVFVVLTIIYGTSNFIPVLIFIIAAVTDAIDGHIARKYNLITTFGKFLDPIADKLLVTAAFVMLTEMGKVPGWITVIIISREMIITGLRVLGASAGITIAASPYGKMKTTTQMLAIIFLLTNNLNGLNIPFDIVLLYLCLFFTVFSGIDYLIKNKSVLDLDNM